MEAYQYMNLYLGCETELGKLTGINETSYFIQPKGGSLIERSLKDTSYVKLILRKISSLTKEESAILNEKGLNIGRPRGYSFSPEAILYLLSLHIDLFNLISQNKAKEISP